MLTQLSIQNYAIVRFLELDLSSGMTTITGETGAGKSIAIDALGLCLGDRAEASMVRPGASKTELNASFDIETNQPAQTWLTEHQLDTDTDCILRRVITAEGRSKAYINGSPVPLNVLREIATLLVNIHGQHAHQLLLKNSHQQRLIDEYGGHSQLLGQVHGNYHQWRSLCHNKETQQEQMRQQQARVQLLQYQVEELDAFNLQPGEFETLEQDHHRLANSTDLLNDCQQLTTLLSQDEQFNVLSLLQQATKTLIPLTEYGEKLQSANDLLHEAIIQVEEANSELIHFADTLEFNPEQLAQLEARMSMALDLARKHQIAPIELAMHHQQLAQELKQLTQQQQQLEGFDAAIDEAWGKYQKLASKLSKQRQRSAKDMAQKITQSIAPLGMEKAHCQIDVTPTPDSPSSSGWDSIEFLISTNPGQPIQPLHKVASGGELSRISLAIEVICADSHYTPTLIFDEVDVGISGPTAAVVGKLLRKLGQNGQIICVTHLPQVASHGHQQMLVSKQQKQNSTETSMITLNQDQRVQEIARLLAGDAITETALANAKELLTAQIGSQ